MGCMLQAYPAELGYQAELGYSAELGFSPFKAIGKVAKGAGKLTVGAVKASAKAAVAPAVFVKDVGTGKNVLKSTVKLVKSTTLGPIQATILDPLNATVLYPVKKKIDTLTNRRAMKLASDRRGPGAKPTAGEHSEARTWTRNQLLKKPPIGTLFAVLASPPEAAYTTNLGNSLGAVPAALVAAIPPALVLMNSLLKQFGSKGGPAPAPSTPGDVAVIQQQQTEAATPPVQTQPDYSQLVPEQYQQIVQEGQDVYTAAQTPEPVPAATEGPFGAPSGTAKWVLGGVSVAALVGGIILAVRS